MRKSFILNNLADWQAHKHCIAGANRHKLFTYSNKSGNRAILRKCLVIFFARIFERHFN